MRRVSWPVVGGAVGFALVGLGIVYLVVACESLPGFLGGMPGDTSPRTGFGVLALVLGVAALGLSAWAVRHRSPGA
jgi:amino acid permease